MSLRIGILGAARVATYAMIAPAREVEGVEVAAVAARDPERARAYAAEHGIPATCANYDALIAAPDIDAIYNALPPNLHARWSVAALEAGKPVLCEKPFTLSLADTDAMLAAEARTGTLLMEAQHSHYHPISARMRQIAHSGMLGDIVHVEGRFTADLPYAPDELRFMPDVGGGALWDLGVYPTYWIRSVLREEPQVVSATQRLHAGGADVATEAQLVTPSGITATMACDMNARDFAASLTITGSRGRLHVRNLLAPQLGHALTLTVDAVTTEEQFPLRPTYAYQLEAFRDALATGVPPATRGANTRATVALLNAIRDKATRD